MAFFLRFKRRSTEQCDPEHLEITTVHPKSEEANCSVSSPIAGSLSSASTMQTMIAEVEATTKELSLVELVAADDDFLVFRRFGKLSARVMLDMQRELAQKEIELELLDRKYGDTDGMDFEKDERFGLMSEIKVKLKEYNDFLLTHEEIRTRPRILPKKLSAVERCTPSMLNAATNAQPPTYLSHPRDFFQLAPQIPRHDALRVFLWRLQHKPGDDLTPLSPKILHQAGWILGVIASILLIAPLQVLKWTTDMNARFSVIMAFIGVFLSAIQILTHARTFETLAVTSGYAAVLMIFMQNNVGGGSVVDTN